VEFFKVRKGYYCICRGRSDSLEGLLFREKDGAEIMQDNKIME
jgi:hypothetical protein